MSVFSDPTSLWIREQTGSPPHKLELVGRALPYRPVSFEGGMRAEFTWYPGNPTATVQMLGSDEKATTINGMWKDRFITVASVFGIGFAGGEGGVYLDGERLLDVVSIVKAVDEFRQRGQLIKFSWGPIIRQGIMTRFRHTWLRRGDVEWEMEFGWVAQRKSPVKILFGPSFNLQDVANAVNDAVQAVIDVVDAVFAVVEGIKGLINAAVGIIESALAAINEVADKVASGILAPFEASEIVLASVQTIKDQTKSIADTLESVPARALRIEADVRTAPKRIAGAEEDAANASPAVEGSAEPSGETTEGGAGGASGAGGSEVAQSTRLAAAQADAVAARSRGIDGITHEEALVAEKYKRDLRAAARNLRAVASDYEQQLLAQTKQVPDVKQYSVREGQDLRDVSTIFYGSQDEWKRLLLYNNLADSRLTAGQVVLIPPLSTLEGS